MNLATALNDNSEELSGDDPMAAYAEASADFAAMATLPDGFEDDEQGDNDDEPEQGKRSISLSPRSILPQYSTGCTMALPFVNLKLRVAF